MAKEIKNIFSDSGCPSEEMMLKYTSDQLQGEEKHAFERHLAGCDFCSEALEGLSLMDNKDLNEDLYFLNKEIDGKTKQGKRAAYWPLAVAASVSIVLLTGTWFYLQNNGTSPLAGSNKEVKQEMPLETPIANAPEEENSKDSMVVKNPQVNASLKEVPEGLNKAKSLSPLALSFNDEIGQEEKLDTKNQGFYANKSEQKKAEKADMSIGNGNAFANGAIINSAPAANVSTFAFKTNMDSVVTLQPSVFNMHEMLAMVEQELQSYSLQEKVSDKKKASSRPATKAESFKDQSLDDCPNCPKKVISEEAEADLEKISMGYAVKKYQAGEYEQAHKQFNEIIQENKNSMQTSEARIYDALSLINLKKSEDALKLTDKVIALNSGNIDAAKWIKASILLSRKEDSKAKIVLDDLSKYNNPYKEKAKEMLNKLK